MTKSTPTAGFAPYSRVKRRIVIIKKGLQVRFILLVVSSVLLAVGIISWDLYYTFGDEIFQELMDPGLYEIFIETCKILFGKLVIYMAFVAIVSVFLSHKLAGPIYRFECSSQTVGGGDLTHRVHLRRGDELEDLKNKFNEMTESLQRFVSKDRRAVQKISADLNDTLESKDLSPEIFDRLQEIKSRIDRLTADFKV